MTIVQFQGSRSQADANEGHRPDVLTSAERDELRRLRRENKRLQTERDILEKTTAWFARETDADAGRSSRPRVITRPTSLCQVLGVCPSGYYAWRVCEAYVADAKHARRVVGWAMTSHLRTELVLDVLNMALAQRPPEDVIHHSDQSCQYTATAFGQRCYDNAMCESFFATLECELLEQHRFTSQAELRMAVFDFIEEWYNPYRRHQSLGQKSPINFERSHQPGLVAESP